MANKLTTKEPLKIVAFALIGIIFILLILLGYSIYNTKIKTEKEEIRISNIIDEFEEKFHNDSLKLVAYNKVLIDNISQKIIDSISGVYEEKLQIAYQNGYLSLSPTNEELNNKQDNNSELTLKKENNKFKRITNSKSNKSDRSNVTRYSELNNNRNTSNVTTYSKLNKSNNSNVTTYSKLNNYKNTSNVTTYSNLNNNRNTSNVTTYSKLNKSYGSNVTTYSKLKKNKVNSNTYSKPNNKYTSNVTTYTKLKNSKQNNSLNVTTQNKQNSSNKNISSYSKLKNTSKLNIKDSYTTNKNNSSTLTHPNNHLNTATNIHEIEFTPIYPGCENKSSERDKKNCLANKMSNFVISNFNSKKINTKNLKKGVNNVRVLFIIDKHGKSKAYDVVGKWHTSIKKEVYRVISIIPKMKPGITNNIKKDVKYSFRIPFMVN